MLQRKFRLLYSPASKYTRYFKTPSFTLRLSRNALRYSRIGIVISKKVDKRAVVRNRTRRVFRTVLEAQKVYTLPGQDMLFVLHKPILEHMEEAQMEAIRLLRQHISL